MHNQRFIRFKRIPKKWDWLYKGYISNIVKVKGRIWIKEYKIGGKVGKAFKWNAKKGWGW